MNYLCKHTSYYLELHMHMTNFCRVGRQGSQTCSPNPARGTPSPVSVRTNCSDSTPSRESSVRFSAFLKTRGRTKLAGQDARMYKFVKTNSMFFE